MFEYEVVTVDRQGQVGERRKRRSESRIEALGKGVNLELVKIPSGRFQMGSPAGEGADDERPQHWVSVNSLWMGRRPVTQAQWKVVAELPKFERDLAPDPSRFKGDDRPVEQVSWFDAVEFCVRLSKKSGGGYRLPSEAEWEYACRAHTTTPFYFGPTLTPNLANYDHNASYRAALGPQGRCLETRPTGDFEAANAFGLHDMHGNVWEWCLDHWHRRYQGAPADGSAWIEGGNDSLRVLRGGSWVVRDCRSSRRTAAFPSFKSADIGFRVISRFWY